MDTCHECKDIIDKLNEEFDALQDKNIKLEKKLEEFEHPKFYYDTEKEWDNKWDAFNENLDTQLNENVKWNYWLSGKIHNDSGIWSGIYWILEEELNELTDNKNSKWCRDISNLICVSIESILESEFINDEIFTKENLMNMISNTIYYIWEKSVSTECIIIIRETEDKDEDEG